MAGLWCVFLMACANSRAAPPPESNDATRIKTLEVRVADLERQLREQFRDPSPLASSDQSSHWWCMAGHSTCFRDRAQCAIKHRQGAAGCEPRRIAYCSRTSECFGDLDVCQHDDATGKFTRFCIGVE